MLMNGVTFDWIAAQDRQAMNYFTTARALAQRLARGETVFAQVKDFIDSLAPNFSTLCDRRHACVKLCEWWVDLSVAPHTRLPPGISLHSAMSAPIRQAAFRAHAFGADDVSVFSFFFSWLGLHPQ